MLYVVRSGQRANVQRGIHFPDDPTSIMVGMAFREWVAGYQTDDVSCWGVAYAEFEARLGGGGATVADELTTELAIWVQQVILWSARPIEVLSRGDRWLGRDESLAVSMIAACQHNLPQAAERSAALLLGQPATQAVVEAAKKFAARLTAVEAMLPGACPVPAGRAA